MKNLKLEAYRCVHGKSIESPFISWTEVYGCNLRFFFALHSCLLSKQMEYIKMVREVITLSVGEAGINLGSTIWQQYNLEHSINPTGDRSMKDDEKAFHSFYEDQLKENLFQEI